MKAALILTAVLAVAGCSCAPSGEDATPDALWGERDAAFRALADAKNAAVETTTTSFTAMKNDTSDPAYQARRKALQDEIDRAQARLDQAECALARARR